MARPSASYEGNGDDGGRKAVGLPKVVGEGFDGGASDGDGHKKRRSWIMNYMWERLGYIPQVPASSRL